MSKKVSQMFYCYNFKNGAKISFKFGAQLQQSEQCTLKLSTSPDVCTYTTL